MIDLTFETMLGYIFLFCILTLMTGYVLRFFADIKRFFN